MTASDRLDPGIFEGLAGVRLAMRRFLSFSEAALSQAGITSQQYQAMLVIKIAAQSQIMVRELSQQMMMQRNGAVQLIDRLEAARLAIRIPSTTDKRSVLVALTEHGETVLETLARAHLGAMLENEPLLVESLAQLRRLAEIG